MDGRVSRHTTLWFFLICFFCSIYFAGWILSPFFSIIILGAVIAGIFYPVYRFICTKFQINDVISSFITCLIIFLILFLPTIFFVGIVVGEVLDLVDMAKSAELGTLLNKVFMDSYVLNKVKLFFNNLGFDISLEQLGAINVTIAKVGKDVGLFLYDQIRAIASNTLSLIINAFLMLLVIFFLLLDGKKLVKFVVDLSPLPREQDEKLIGKFRDIAGAILIGNGLCALIQGFVGGIIFWCFGLSSALLWGVLMFFLAFLPIIGIGVIFLPTAIYLFFKGKIIISLLTVVFYILLSAGTEYILKPNFVGHRVKMHTLVVFFSFLGGLKIFGILGIIYGPLISTAFLTLADIYRTNYRNLSCTK